MNLAAGVSLISFASAILFAFLSLGFATAPGWKELRWFALIAGSAAGYCMFDVIPSIGAPVGLITLGSRLGLTCAAIHLMGWMRYIATLERRSNTRMERSILLLMSVVAALALLPGVLVSSKVSYQFFSSLRVTYGNAVPTFLGDIGNGCFVFSLGVPLAHYIRRWRRGATGAAAHAIGLGILSAAGLNDALAASGYARTPYLVDVGFLAVVVAVGGAMVRRFVESARALEQLSSRLGRDVEERTRDLVHTQQELSTAERLAAIGRLAAGVAHEINNPAAAIMANLCYLREQLDQNGVFPVDGAECVTDSLVCTDRIAGIVRQLLSAARQAGESRHSVPFPLARALANAEIAARHALGERVSIDSNLPAEIHVLGESAPVEQVLVNLIVNAAQAIHEVKSSGNIQVTAEIRGQRVLLRLTDNGPGIDGENRSRLFEPFFTTKGVGKGTGLGLAVSRGLVRAMDGDLLLESTSPSGTTMLIDLPLGLPSEETDSQRKLASDFPRYRLLVVDDDPSVRAALGRILGAKYAVELADGVTDALARVRQGAIDFVLCDVIMPDGGAFRFLSELQKMDPTVAAMTVFLTGGATTLAARSFVEAHAERVLSKPLDPDALRAMLRRLLDDKNSANSVRDPQQVLVNNRA